MNILMVFALAIALFSVTLIICKKLSDTATKKFLFGIALGYIVVCLVRHYLPDGFCYADAWQGYWNLSQSFLRWGLGICAVVNFIALVCDNKFFKNMSILICLPLAIVSTMYYNEFMSYFTGKVFPWDDHWAQIAVPQVLQHIQFSFELALSMVLPLLVLFVQNHKVFEKNRDIRDFALGLVPVCIMCVPMFVPISLFGETTVVIGGRLVPTLIWTAGFISATVIAYFVFRFTSDDTRYSVCLFCSTAIMMFFAQKGILGPSLSRISLFQLCNISNFLIFIGLIFKIRPILDFTAIVNTLGAIIAYCAPDVKEGIFRPWGIHFFYDHAMLLCMPALFMALRITTRVDKTTLKNALVGFAIYFGFCFVAGTLINGIYDGKLINHTLLDKYNLWDRANFFYLFDHERILETAPFLKFLYGPHFTIARYFDVYPLWIAFFAIAFSGAIVLIWWIYKLATRGLENLFVWLNVKGVLRSKVEVNGKLITAYIK